MSDEQTDEAVTESLADALLAYRTRFGREKTLALLLHLLLECKELKEKV